MKTTDRDEEQPVDERILTVRNNLIRYGQLEPEQRPDKTQIETLEVL